MRDETRTILDSRYGARPRHPPNTSSIATARRCAASARAAAHGNDFVYVRGPRAARAVRPAGDAAAKPRRRDRRHASESRPGEACPSATHNRATSTSDPDHRRTCHIPPSPVTSRHTSESSPRRPPRVLSSGDASRESEVSVTGSVMAFAHSSAVDERVEYSGWESDGGTFPLHRSIVRRIGHAQYLSVVPC